MSKTNLDNFKSVISSLVQDVNTEDFVTFGGLLKKNQRKRILEKMKRDLNSAYVQVEVINTVDYVFTTSYEILINLIEKEMSMKKGDPNVEKSKDNLLHILNTFQNENFGIQQPNASSGEDEDKNQDHSIHSIYSDIISVSKEVETWGTDAGDTVETLLSLQEKISSNVKHIKDLMNGEMNESKLLTLRKTLLVLSRLSPQFQKILEKDKDPPCFRTEVVPLSNDCINQVISIDSVNAQLKKTSRPVNHTLPSHVVVNTKSDTLNEYDDAWPDTDKKEENDDEETKRSKLERKIRTFHRCFGPWVHANDKTLMIFDEYIRSCHYTTIHQNTPSPMITQKGKDYIRILKIILNLILYYANTCYVKQTDINRKMLVDVYLSVFKAEYERVKFMLDAFFMEHEADPQKRSSSLLPPIKKSSTKDGHDILSIRGLFDRVKSINESNWSEMSSQVIRKIGHETSKYLGRLTDDLLECPLDVHIGSVTHLSIPGVTLDMNDHFSECISLFNYHYTYYVDDEIRIHPVLSSGNEDTDLLDLCRQVLNDDEVDTNTKSLQLMIFFHSKYWSPSTLNSSIETSFFTVESFTAQNIHSLEKTLTQMSASSYTEHLREATQNDQLTSPFSDCYSALLLALEEITERHFTPEQLEAIKEIRITPEERIKELLNHIQLPIGVLLFTLDTDEINVFEASRFNHYRTLSSSVFYVYILQKESSFYLLKSNNRKVYQSTSSSYSGSNNIDSKLLKSYFNSVLFKLGKRKIREYELENNLVSSSSQQQPQQNENEQKQDVDLPVSKKKKISNEEDTDQSAFNNNNLLAYENMVLPDNFILDANILGELAKLSEGLKFKSDLDLIRSEVMSLVNFVFRGLCNLMACHVKTEELTDLTKSNLTNTNHNLHYVLVNLHFDDDLNVLPSKVIIPVNKNRYIISSKVVEAEKIINTFSSQTLNVDKSKLGLILTSPSYDKVNYAYNDEQPNVGVAVPLRVYFEDMDSQINQDGINAKSMFSASNENKFCFITSLKTKNYNWFGETAFIPNAFMSSLKKLKNKFAPKDVVSVLLWLVVYCDSIIKSINQTMHYSVSQARTIGHKVDIVLDFQKKQIAELYKFRNIVLTDVQIPLVSKLFLDRESGIYSHAAKRLYSPNIRTYMAYMKSKITIPDGVTFNSNQDLDSLSVWKFTLPRFYQDYGLPTKTRENTLKTKLKNPLSDYLPPVAANSTSSGSTLTPSLITPVVPISSPHSRVLPSFLNDENKSSGNTKSSSKKKESSKSEKLPMTTSSSSSNSTSSSSSSSSSSVSKKDTDQPVSMFDVSSSSSSPLSIKLKKKSETTSSSGKSTIQEEDPELQKLWVSYRKQIKTMKFDDEFVALTQFKYFEQDLFPAMVKVVPGKENHCIDSTLLNYYLMNHIVENNRHSFGVPSFLFSLEEEKSSYNIKVSDEKSYISKIAQMVLQKKFSRKIFIPLHVKSIEHWILIVIDRETKSIHLYDNLMEKSKGKPVNGTSVAIRLSKNMNDFLERYELGSYTITLENYGSSFITEHGLTKACGYHLLRFALDYATHGKNVLQRNNPGALSFGDFMKKYLSDIQEDFKLDNPQTVERIEKENESFNSILSEDADELQTYGDEVLDVTDTYSQTTSSSSQQ